MEMEQLTGRAQAHRRHGRAAAFCLACVAINTGAAYAATVLNLPVYLDTLGTVLSCMLGGYVPGIIVGYVTNLVNAGFDSASIYYGIINVLNAVLAAYLAKRRWFEYLPYTLLAIPIFALASGLLGSLIAFAVNGGDASSELAASLARQLEMAGVHNAAASYVLAELCTNFVDKTLVLLSCTLVYHMLPESFVASLDFVPWQQAPLSQAEFQDTMGEKPRRMSLATKLIMLVATIVTFIVVATTMFSQITYHRSMVEAETGTARSVTHLMETVVDPSRVAEFLEKGDQAPGYAEVEARLADIRDSFEDVKYVYVYQIQPDGCHVVLDPDTADEPGSDPGDVVAFDESFQSMLPALLAGEEIEPVISDETYGWLLTVYKPLKDKTGTTVCYLAADISMEHLVSEESSFLAGIVSLFAAFFILVCSVVIWLTKYNVIIPVNSISHVANGFMIGGKNMRAETLEPISRLDIRTGDEIENLYGAVERMAQNTLGYIDEAQGKSDTISRMQSNLIMVMADLVESRDKFTGDHVRNTAAYARIIMNQMRREGICADVLTNEFISNVYQSAPLHDIGKIAVSDTILNKPGRLTAEEFEIMKGHTLAGQQILEGAKSAVSESSYLDEAQRLAAYHHEKWDGSGYPYGLAGEEIPLSARIMAVADVFDALVSKRSYKAGFPVDKAFAIIEEGIGTHFDPKVARAFLHARDKARAVAEKSNEKKRLEEEEAERKLAANDDAAPTNDAS
ncbi:MAG: HD domain-containing protein [Atopobiaceae bacterium]|nr:HD domain-containing protein [Atopobiaceae bacterium]